MSETNPGAGHYKAESDGLWYAFDDGPGQNAAKRPSDTGGPKSIVAAMSIGGSIERTKRMVAIALLASALVLGIFGLTLWGKADSDAADLSASRLRSNFILIQDGVSPIDDHVDPDHTPAIVCFALAGFGALSAVILFAGSRAEGPSSGTRVA